MDLAPVTVEGAPTPEAPANGLPPGVSDRAIPTEDPGHVALTDPDGAVQSVPIENAERAVKQYGYRPSSDVEYYTAKTGTAGTIAAGVAGMGRGLSFGLFDPIEIELSRATGGDQSAEEMRRTLNLLREGHGTASTVGEIGGSLASLAFGLPPGEAAAVAGESMLARAGSRALQAAPRLFGEGAAMSVGEQLSEDTLGNHEIVAGKYLAAGLQGGVVNLLIGAGLTSAGGAVMDKLAARKAGRAIESVIAEAAPAERAVGGGAPVTAEPVASGVAKPRAADKIAQTYIDNVPGQDREVRKELADAWAKRERVFSDQRQTVEDATRRFGKDLNVALESGRLADMASFGESKVNQMSRLVDQGRFTDQAQAAIMWLSDANAIVQNISKDATAGLGPTAVKKWGGYMQKVADAIESGSGVRLHEALDNTKRFIGHEAAFGKGPFGLTVAQREFDHLYQGENGIKGLLESAVWGDAASGAQREINAATHEMLSQGKLFTRKFTTEFGSDAGRPLYAADTAAIGGFMGRLTNAANDLDAHGVESWLKSRKGFLDAIERNYEFDGPAQRAISKEREALARLEKTYRDTTADVTLGNKVRAALEEERARGIGGALGAAIDIAGKPYTTLQRLAHLEHTTHGIADRLAGVRQSVDAFDSKLDASVKAFYKDGPAPERSGAAKSVTPAERQALRAAVSNPAVLTQKIADHVASTGLQEAAPNVARALTASLMRAATLVQQKLPREPSPVGVSFGHKEPRALGPRQQAELDRALSALDVDKTLDDLAHGRLSREQIEAVKFVNPPLFAEMQAAVRKYGYENDPAVSIQQEMALRLMFDTPVSRYTQPATVRGFQQAFAQGAPPDPAQAGGPQPTPIGSGESKAARSLASPTDRMEASDAL